MKVYTFPYGPLGSNMYVLSINDSYFIVDPSVSPDRVLSSNKFDENFFSNVKAILVTHAHFDHVMYVDKWAEVCSCPIYMSDKDAPLLKDSDTNCSSFMYADVSFGANTVDCGNIINIEDISIEVISTPGHTPGSVCYLFTDFNIMFTGDMLFAGSVGRVDLPLGSQPDMLRSIDIIKSLNDDIEVYPGHGYYTKVGLEKKNNPFFK